MNTAWTVGIYRFDRWFLLFFFPLILLFNDRHFCIVFWASLWQEHRAITITISHIPDGLDTFKFTTQERVELKAFLSSTRDRVRPIICFYRYASSYYGNYRRFSYNAAEENNRWYIEQEWFGLNGQLRIWKSETTALTKKNHLHDTACKNQHHYEGAAHVSFHLPDRRLTVHMQHNNIIVRWNDVPGSI